MAAPIIYAASDFHGRLPDIPADADFLILAGDICPDYAGVPRDSPEYWARQGLWLHREFRQWLESRPVGCTVVAVWGNHDFVGEHPDFVPDLPWILLQDEEVLFDGGIRVYGTPWVPGLPRWAFYASDGALERRSDVIADGLDILISHGPPRGAGDLIPGGSAGQLNKYGNLHDLRVGDLGLRELCCTDRNGTPRGPKVLICGHIHEDRGVHTCGVTTVYNVAAVDANYTLHVNAWTRIYLD